MKQCYICKQFKELNEFSKDKRRKDGLQLSCKKCFSDYRLKNREKILKQKAEARAKLTEEEKKEITKYMSDYYQSNKEQISVRITVYRKENKEKITVRKKIYIEENRQEIAVKQSIYQKKNRKGANIRQGKYQKNNPGKVNANTANHRAAKLQATPPWITKEQKKEIQGFYILAKELQWLSEEPLQVDHIIPLQGENVSGLHVPWNLQILPRPLNASKNNKLVI